LDHTPAKLNVYHFIQQIDRKTVVFDLDETLVHCNANYVKDADLQLMITFPTGEDV